MIQDPVILLIVASAVVLLSGVISGLTGFGFGLVAIPAMTLLMPPKLVVPTSILLGFSSRLMLGLQLKREINFRRVGMISVGSVVGAAAGALLLSSQDSEVLKFVIGLTMVLSAAVLLRGARMPLPDNGSAYAPVGFLSGLFQGCAGMGGPPVVILFANLRVEKQKTRADLSAALVVVSITAMASQLACGLITADVLRSTIYMAPPALIGTAAGVRFADRMSNEAFRRIILWLVLLTGAIAIMAVAVG